MPQKDQQIAKQIFDLETGEFHLIETERQDTATRLFQALQGASLFVARALQEIWDNKYYLELGFSSKEEFCGAALPFGMRTAQKYVAVGRKFQNFLPENTNTDSHLDNNPLQGIGIENLYQLTLLGDEDLKALTAGNKVKAGGSEIDIEDMQQLAKRDFAATCKQIRGKYSSKVSTLAEENKLLKAEAEAKAKLVTDAEESIALAEDIERKYGEKASTVEAKKTELELARNSINNAIQYIERAGIDTSDPTGLQEDLLGLIKKLDGLHQRMVANYDEVIAANAGLM